MTNVGSTPAYNFRTHTKAAVGETRLERPAFDALFNDLTSTDLTEMTIVHGQTIGAQLFADDVTEQQLDDCKLRRSSLYVVGRVDYADIFGEPHHTFFTHVFSGPEMNGMIYRHGRNETD